MTVVPIVGSVIPWQENLVQDLGRMAEYEFYYQVPD